MHAHANILYAKIVLKRIMNSGGLLERISIDPKVMVGKPIIRGTRLTVEYILGLLANGSSIEDILAEYRGLERDDILACLLFASKALGDSSFVPSKIEAI